MTDQMTMEDTTHGAKARVKTKEETQRRYRPLHFQASGHCTFCGAPMSPSDTLCEECGMSADGVVCPNCGTLNFRPFCSKCNAPLNRAAVRAVEKAKEDPKVQEAARLMEQAAELEDTLKNTTDEQKKSETQETYQRVVKDINQLFEEMLPPVGSTPEEQFNYYSARRVAVEQLQTVKRTIKAEWVCNYCGCHHRQPSDCVEPWQGGTWIYETEEVTIHTKTYEYEE